MWGNILVGGLSDQTNFIIWSFISDIPFKITLASLGDYSVYRDILHSQLYPWTSNEPIFMTFMSFFLSLFGPNFYNVFLILTLILNLYFSYSLFKRFNHSWFYILIFNFSSYFWLHLGEHLELMQLWLGCLVVKFTLDDYWKSNPYKFGLFLTIACLISNYIGFFSLLYFLAYSIPYIFVYRKTNSAWDIVVPLFKVLIVFFISTAVILYPYLKANIFSPAMAHHEIASKNVVRTLDEYISFSSRPWYLLLPSTANPFLGSLAQRGYTWLSSTKNYLMDDYFARESPSNYLGLSFLILIAVFITMKYKELSPDLKNRITILFLVSFVIFILMMPPVITVFGITLYNVSFLFYKVVPVFRVMLRFSVFLHLTLLMTVGYISTAKSFRYQKQIFLLVLVATLLETYIPVKFTKLEAPEIYSFINHSVTSPSFFAVYPYSRAKEAMFWVPVHKQYLVNPRGYIKEDFSSEEFTGYLREDPSKFYSIAQSVGIKYIVNFDNNTYDLMPKDKFRLIQSFDEGMLYEVMY